MSASASADDSVYWKQLAGTDLPGSGKSMVEPDQMILYSCGSCGLRLVELTWQNWGSPTAIGTGKVVPDGGPGTCGYPPKGCHYPNVTVTVSLSNIRKVCGESRYMSERTLINGKNFRWPDADCKGFFKIPPPQLPKPRLGKVNAKHLVSRTMKSKRTYFYRRGFDQSIHCRRANRLKVKCKVKWYAQVRDNGELIVVKGTARGSVTRVKGGKFFVRLRYRIAPVGSNPFGHTSFGVIRVTFS